MVIKRVFRLTALLILVIAFSTSSLAGWTVANLTPPESSGAIAFGRSNGIQVGIAECGGIAHAGLWNGQAASWVDLHPTGARESQARAWPSLEIMDTQV